MRRARELDAAAGGIVWLEEPVSSEDAAGLRFVRDRTPPAMAVAAGEYAWTPADAGRLLDEEAVDVLQLDATRCLGFSGFRAAAALAAARGVAVSGHCAPALHAHAGCAVERFAHLEYFHDHVRIEHLLFDGAQAPDAGMLRRSADAPGHGLTLRHDIARTFAVDA